MPKYQAYDLATPAPEDLLLILDVSDTTDESAGTTKKVTVESLGWIYFTEAFNNTAPNDTVTAVQLNVAATAATGVEGATGPADSTDMALTPRGAGALLLRIADNDGNGNKRGGYAVDLQSYPSDTTHIASGVASALLGGGNNTASSLAASVVGGVSNTASGDRTFVGGGLSNIASGPSSSTVGGEGSTASGVRSFVGGGLSNTATETHSCVIAGYMNNSTGVRAGIVAGTTNTADGENSVVLGGETNQVNSLDSAIIGGSNNAISGEWSAILGGNYNTVAGQYSACIAGQVNQASGYLSLTLGGEYNTASANFSIASGISAKTFNNTGKMAYGANSPYPGSEYGTLSQAGKLVLGGNTLVDTTIILSFSGGVDLENSQFMIQDNQAMAFTGRVIAKAHAASQVGAWKIEGVISRGTGAASTTLLFSTVDELFSTLSGASLTLSADTTNGALSVTFSGANNISVVAYIDSAEVI